MNKLQITAFQGVTLWHSHRLPTAVMAANHVTKVSSYDNSNISTTGPICNCSDSQKSLNTIRFDCEPQQVPDIKMSDILVNCERRIVSLQSGLSKLEFI